MFEKRDEGLKILGDIGKYYCCPTKIRLNVECLEDAGLRYGKEQVKTLGKLLWGLGSIWSVVHEAYHDKNVKK